MNTCDLEGADLDTAVARALGYTFGDVGHGVIYVYKDGRPVVPLNSWKPSTNGHYLIEEFGIATRKHSNGTWYAMMQQNAGDCVQVHWNEYCYRRTPANPECKRIRQRWQGRTMLEAAMRCLVGWHLGEVVEL